jgi:hypothetical protein
MSKRKNKPQSAQVYTVMDELLASPVNPLAQRQIDHHLGIIIQAFESLQRGERPTLNDVMHVGDCVNMLDAITGMRFNEKGDQFEQIEFSEDTRREAANAVGRCVIRGREVGIYRFDAPGLVVIREVIEFYTGLIEAIPARVFIKAHRQNVKDCADAVAGKLNRANIELVEV